MRHNEREACVFRHLQHGFSLTLTNRARLHVTLPGWYYPMVFTAISCHGYMLRQLRKQYIVLRVRAAKVLLTHHGKWLFFILYS
jgi:hypothetical protein